MEHGARQNTTRVIAVGFISLGTLLTLSLATNIIQGINNGNDSNLLIVFYVQIMPDDFVMQLHRF
ncbi:conjugal transfer pilus assembly protein TraE [Klebsiella pneumoniae]|nr:conjugal transfer pilus assembly protein TraE [Klebsiella pneumoniae]